MAGFEIFAIDRLTLDNDLILMIRLRGMKEETKFQLQNQLNQINNAKITVQTNDE